MVNWQEVLKDYGSKRILLKDEVLFHLDEEADAFYLLLSGYISLYKLNHDGQETSIRKVMPGEIFGEVMVFTESNYPVGAVAGKDSQLIEYSRQEIVSAIKHNSEISMFFIKVLSQRCLMLNDKIYQFSLQDVLSRLAGFLLKYIEDNELIAKAKAGEAFEMAIPKKEIASSIGTIAETLSRNFQKLHKMGVLKVFGKTVIVQDYAKLKELSGV